MAKFESEYGSLVLQDGDGVWAAFEGGRFETSDRDVVARLRKAEGVTEVKSSEK